MSRPEKHQTRILELLESPKTFKELEIEIGTDIDIRNPINSLLIKKKIRIGGYETSPKHFTCKNLVFKKVKPNAFDQIHLKDLIENAYNNNNFYELLETFESKVKIINEMYLNDEALLKETLDKMSIVTALDHLKSRDFYSNTRVEPNRNKTLIEKLEQRLKDNPNSKIWYFKEYKGKNLLLKKVFIVSGGPPYFLHRPYIDDDDTMTIDEFIRLYYRTLYYLPIHSNFIDELFDKVIKHVLTIDKEKREEYQWELAELLSNEGNVRMFAYFLNNFIEEIENQDPVNPDYMKDVFL